MSETIEITKELTSEGIEKLKKGQILMFQKDGKRIDLKITAKRKGRVWAKEVDTYTPDEALVILKDKREINAKKENKN